MRGQARKKVKRLVTQDGSDWKLAVVVKKKTGQVVKKSAIGREKTKEATNDNGESSELGRGDMCVETSKGAGWMDDCRLNPGLVRDAQERDAVIGLFLQFKKKGQISSHTGNNGKV